MTNTGEMTETAQGTEVLDEKDLHLIKEDVIAAANELMDRAKLGVGDLLVVGCSTSEVRGAKIGTESGEDIGKAIFSALYGATMARGVELAIQCCEHLNRALVTERATAKRQNATICNAVPQLHAGGATAMAAYKGFAHPVVVEEIQADAGLDIGDTFIGMHLKRVAVPVRLAVENIGYAHLTAARVRPKYIGGVRAVYDEDLM